MLKLKLILLLYLCQHANSKCRVIEKLFSCQSDGIEGLYKEFHRDEFREHIPVIRDIELSGANVSKIQHLFKLPLMEDITSVTIKNCQVSSVSERAFIDYGNLTTLDLGFNSIEDTVFIETLPDSLSVLLLNNNKIPFLVPSFGRHKKLRYVDLSFNMLKAVEFEKIHTLHDINLSYNEIVTLVPNQEQHYYNLDVIKMNLSHNQLKEYDESRIFAIIDWLDLSHNHLTFLNLKYEKYFLSLAHCVVDSVRDRIHAKKAVLTDVKGIERIKLTGNSLVLNDNDFGDLASGGFDFRDFFAYDPIRYLDLSNSSINSIPEKFFSDIRHCSKIDLRYNRIEIVRKNAFKNSIIDVLDLSYSNIKTLEISSLSNNSFGVLDLSHNVIDTFVRAFHNSSIRAIDLSFNSIKIVPRSSFRFVSDLERLNLSNCAIGGIDPNVFARLNVLRELDLSNNKLKALGDALHSLPVSKLSLKGNRLGSIRANDFSNLHYVRFLDLSGSDIREIESKAFANLSRMEEIDISDNEIEEIAEDLFVETPKLAKISLRNNPIKSLRTFSNRLNLKELTLSVTGTLKPRQIDNFNLKTLTIEDSVIETLTADSFKGLYSLTELHFNGSSVRRIEEGALNDLFNLEYLDVGNLFENITSLKKGMFGDLEGLETLNFSGLSIETIESGSFSGLVNVKVLRLDDNNVKELIGDAFSGLRSLSALNLSANKIARIAPGAFSDLRSLKILFLENNRLETLPFGLFRDSEELEILQLQNNALKDLENDCFSGAAKISELNLAENKLEILKPGIFKHLAEMRILKLEHNNLGMGGSPQHSFKFGVLSNLRKLKTLNLSYNSFSVLHVKTVLTPLKGLEELLLDHNQLQNLDFVGISGNCKNLKSIGISYNKWHCDFLADAVEFLYKKGVDYYPEVADYYSDNVEGINCTDVCKYIFCEGEDAEIVRRQ